MAAMQALRIPLSLIPEPSRTFSVVDGRRSPYTFLEANTHFVRKGADIGSPDPNPSTLGIRPHDMLNNWLFCDGHVERLSVESSLGSGTPMDSRGIWSRTVGD